MIILINQAIVKCIQDFLFIKLNTKTTNNIYNKPSYYFIFDLIAVTSQYYPQF